MHHGVHGCNHPGPRVLTEHLRAMQWRKPSRLPCRCCQGTVDASRSRAELCIGGHNNMQYRCQAAGATQCIHSAGAGTMPTLMNGCSPATTFSYASTRLPSCSAARQAQCSARNSAQPSGRRLVAAAGFHRGLPCRAANTACCAAALPTATSSRSCAPAHARARMGEVVGIQHGKRVGTLPLYGGGGSSGRRQRPCKTHHPGD